MAHKRYTTKTLEKGVTLSSSPSSDLKMSSDKYRYWLSRYSPEEGEPFESTVYVEALSESTWVLIDCYDGENPSSTPRPDISSEIA